MDLAERLQMQDEDLSVEPDLGPLEEMALRAPLGEQEPHAERPYATKAGLEPRKSYELPRRTGRETTLSRSPTRSMRRQSERAHLKRYASIYEKTLNGEGMVRLQRSYLVDGSLTQLAIYGERQLAAAQGRATYPVERIGQQHLFGMTAEERRQLYGPERAHAGYGGPIAQGYGARPSGYSAYRDNTYKPEVLGSSDPALRKAA